MPTTNMRFAPVPTVCDHDAVNAVPTPPKLAVSNVIAADAVIAIITNNGATKETALSGLNRNPLLVNWHKRRANLVMIRFVLVSMVAFLITGLLKLMLSDRC
jgi:hypothetical protein